jgi:tyrosyl-tRNA synthetase
MNSGSTSTETLIKELKDRGLVEHHSAELETIFSKKRIVYLGIDPSADSLQAGNLFVLLTLRRLAEAGHKIILLVGGGTGMIGDPREKGERSLLDMKVVEKNKKAIRAQMQSIIGAKVMMVDNADWLLKVKMSDFLRDIGKHFTVNELIKRDIIKRRLETPDESISYTEFTYALLQGYDYMVLNEKYGCDLQIGGSDQWTNILSGVDLIRKRLGKEAYALATPIVTDANGKKFGKSEGNAVWLDAKKTSSYAFYQFWLNQPDEVVEKYLKFYTFMSVREIEAMVELHSRNPGRREAQKMLASLVTEIVHGKNAAANAAAVSEVLFSTKPLTELNKDERATLLAEAPSLRLGAEKLVSGYPVVDALAESGLSSSKSDARRLIEGKGVSINDQTIEGADTLITPGHLTDGLALMRRGKQVVVLTIEK